MCASKEPKMLHGYGGIHILDLPYDLFYIILQLSWDPKNLNDKHFPVYASHICRLWRQYVLDTPHFWTSITFHESIQEIEKNSIWLERSKGAAFDLEIGWQLFEQSSVKHAKAIMRLVVPHAHRMRSLRLERVPFKIRKLVFDRLDQIGCPALERLQVQKEWEFFTTRHPQSQLRPFRKGGAPQLKEVLLTRIPLEYFMNRFKDLRLLDVVNGALFDISAENTVRVLHTILSTLPKLQVLRVHQEHWQLGYSEPADLLGFQSSVPPMRHDNLQELGFIGAQADTSAFIASTILPSLRYLYGDSQSDLPVGVSCLPVLAKSASLPKLARLHLSGGQNPDGTFDQTHSSLMSFLKKALEGLPSLEHLGFDAVNFEGNKHLACLSECCPNLQSLTLSCCSGYTLLGLRSVIRRRGEVEGFDPCGHIVLDDPWSHRLDKLVDEAKKDGGEGVLDFGVELRGGTADLW